MFSPYYPQRLHERGLTCAAEIKDVQALCSSNTSHACLHDVRFQSLFPVNPHADPGYRRILDLNHPITNITVQVLIRAASAQLRQVANAERERVSGLEAERPSPSADEPVDEQQHRSLLEAGTAADGLVQVTAQWEGLNDVGGREPAGNAGAPPFKVSSSSASIVCAWCEAKMLRLPIRQGKSPATKQKGCVLTCLKAPMPGRGTLGQHESAPIARTELQIIALA